MNYSIILKMLSMVVWIMAFAFSICASVGFFYPQSTLESDALPYWINIIAMSVTVAFALYLPSRNAPAKLYKKEALCIVGLSWIIVSFMGALPYIFILDINLADGFFESASGLTTTGASIFSSFEDFPHSLMFWRCMSHWIGGLGVLVFFVAILSFMGSSGRILYASESSFTSGGGIENARIQNIVFKTLALYIVLTTLCATTFYLTGMQVYDAICHAFGTVSTGGFSVYESSISFYNDNSIYWAVITFMFIGGISFLLILALLAGNFKKVFQNTELRVYVSLIVLVSLVISFFIVDDKTSLTAWHTAITHAAFQTVSIMTTTGFATYDYELWLPVTQILLIFVAIVGGCAGSTSGGLKVSRFVSSIKIVISDLEKSFRPRVVRNIKLNGNTLNSNDTYGVLSYIVLFALIMIFSMVVLAILEPNLSITGTVTATLACLNNVGPGFGEVGPTKNYAFMHDGTKFFLTILMIMGRLEFYALLVLLMPSLWKKFQ